MKEVANGDREDSNREIKAENDFPPPAPHVALSLAVVVLLSRLVKRRKRYLLIGFESIQSSTRRSDLSQIGKRIRISVCTHSRLQKDQLPMQLLVSPIT
ncbi:hypothetical protein L2E82_46769 [Cichorium intybus]|uniref:Uncharacterized protein n=1 Tax=Cichorium intybus TaxID=13427 RepID=A0ACB8YV95_CICIN|nr:hypothetical protein L2E82_46769 [Cichorium intybus]